MENSAGEDAVRPSAPLPRKDSAMAEQRPPGSSGPSPTQESGRQERDQAHEVSTQGSETARQVARTASASYEQGREQLEQAGQSLEETIREKPLGSVLIAAGIGLLLAFLWKG
jgi:ElaB/YqjD/DUF883 family membrane-anchored ribosome-binding protein